MDPPLDVLPSPLSGVACIAPNTPGPSGRNKKAYQVPTEFQCPEDADIVLRSCDNFDFRAHKFILSKASQVFQGIFDIPMPLGRNQMSIDDDHWFKDGLPLVVMAESHETMENLLRLCYPTDDPVVTSFDEARDTLAAMTKYEMDEKRSGWMKSTLVSFAETEPWLVYAFALHLSRITSHYPYQMEECARVAARFTLRYPLLGSSMPEVRDINPEDYMRLERYHKKCAIRLTEMIITGDLIVRTGSSWVWLHPCSVCEQSDTNMMITVMDMKNNISGYANRWWMKYYDRAKEAVDKRPCGRVVEDESLWMDLVQDLVSTCMVCSRRAMEEMPHFVRRFSEEIDKATAEIRLEIV